MWISYQAVGYFGTGVVPQPQGSGIAMVVPYQAFPTADGQVMIAAGSDALFVGSPTRSARRSWRATRASPTILGA